MSQSRLESLSIPTLDIGEKFEKIVINKVKCYLFFTTQFFWVNCIRSLKVNNIAKRCKLKRARVELQPKKCIRDNHGQLFETNFRFHIKQRIKRKVHYGVFSNFAIVLRYFYFRRRRRHNTVISNSFCSFPETYWFFKVQSSSATRKATRIYRFYY